MAIPIVKFQAQGYKISKNSKREGFLWIFLYLPTKFGPFLEDKLFQTFSNLN